MQPRLTDFHRLAVPAALIAAGLAFGAGGARADDDDKRRPRIDVSIHKGTLEIVGTSSDDALALRLKEGKPEKLEIDAGDDGKADFRVKRRKFERISIEARGGADRVRIDDSNGSFTDAQPATIDGGADDDALLGGRGAEVLIAGDGNDAVDGNQGNDVAFLGAGDDRFTWDPGDGSDVVEGQTGQDELDFNGSGASDDVAFLGAELDIFRWDPGDGSDVVEGQSGHDVMLFNGSGANEVFDVSANGQRVRFTRNVGNIVMDLDGVEKIETLAFGGADTYTANDLSGTAVGALAVNVGAVLGSPATDAQPDNVIVNGTNGDDAIAVAGSAGSVNVTGLAASVAITRAEAALDRLAINGLGGADTLDDSGLAPNTIGLSFTQ